MRWAHLRGEDRAELAARAALSGGLLAQEHGRPADIQWKHDGSMVTEVDHAIEQRLRALIGTQFSDDAILGEEGRGTPGDAEFCWVLDPLDGTANFGRGLPGFSVSVGVLCRGVPFAGAVYDPTADWLFTGCRGRGACLNGRPIRAGAEPLGPRALLTVRTPYPDGVPPYALAWLRCHRIRRFGSTALHLCYTAMGGLALVHDQRAAIWDVAGAAPALFEAGGVCTRPDGTSLFPATPAELAGAPLGFLAGNPTAHGEALAALRAETAWPDA